MIKVVKSELKTKVNRISYPKLMRSDDLVVLFSDHTSGVVINCTRDYRIGYHSQHWDHIQFTDCNKSETFTFSNM